MTKTQLMLLGTRIRLTGCRLRLMMDAWEESDHPRDEDGKFRGDGSNSSRKSTHKKNRYRREPRHGTIKLAKREYARVVSEINTNLPKEQRKKKYCTKAVGDYEYFFRNLGFGDYEFLGKKKIR